MSKLKELTTLINDYAGLLQQNTDPKKINLLKNDINKKIKSIESQFNKMDKSDLDLADLLSAPRQELAQLSGEFSRLTQEYTAGITNTKAESQRQQLDNSFEKFINQIVKFKENFPTADLKMSGFIDKLTNELEPESLSFKSLKI